MFWIDWGEAEKAIGTRQEAEGTSLPAEGWARGTKQEARACQPKAGHEALEKLITVKWHEYKISKISGNRQ